MFLFGHGWIVHDIIVFACTVVFFVWPVLVVGQPAPAQGIGVLYVEYNRCINFGFILRNSADGKYALYSPTDSRPATTSLDAA